MRRIRVLRATSAEIFDSGKRPALVERIAGLGKNILVFGMPNSGKSTLVRAACGAFSKFRCTDEEEILTQDDGESIKADARGRRWIAGHQFPGMREDASDDCLRGFAAKNLGLNPEKWAILRIRGE